jgi:hypothetical protein
MKFLPSRQPTRDLSPKSHRPRHRRAAAGSQDFFCGLPGPDHYRSIRRGVPAKTAACREPVAVYRSKAAPRQAPKHLNPDHISLGDFGDRRIRPRRGAQAFAYRPINGRKAPTAAILRVANNEGHGIIRRNPGVENNARSRRGLRGWRFEGSIRRTVPTEEIDLSGIEKVRRFPYGLRR